MFGEKSVAGIRGKKIKLKSCPKIHKKNLYIVMNKPLTQNKLYNNTAFSLFLKKTLNVNKVLFSALHSTTFETTIRPMLF